MSCPVCGSEDIRPHVHWHDCMCLNCGALWDEDPGEESREEVVRATPSEEE